MELITTVTNPTVIHGTLVSTCQSWKRNIRPLSVSFLRGLASGLFCDRLLACANHPDCAAMLELVSNAMVEQDLDIYPCILLPGVSSRLCSRTCGRHIAEKVYFKQFMPINYKRLHCAFLGLGSPTNHGLTFTGLPLIPHSLLSTKSRLIASHSFSPFPYSFSFLPAHLTSHGKSPPSATCSPVCSRS